MLTIEQLRKARVNALEEAKSIEQAANDEDREQTKEEGERIDTLIDNAKVIGAQIEGREQADSRSERLATGLAELDEPEGRRTSPDSVMQPARVKVGKDRWEDDPQLGFKTYGDFCRTVKAASLPGSGIDDRLLKIRAAAQGANTQSGEEGGFLVPPEYSNRIYERASQLLPVLNQCDRLTIGGNSITVNGTVDHNRNGTTYRYGGVVVYWVEEAAQITRSTLKFRQITLKLNKLGALSYVTEEEMSDANINFGARLLQKHAEGIADELVEAVMFGTGVGQPLGAFASDACISTTKETGQAADTIVFENIINMSADIWAPSMGKANWYYNGECLPQLRTMVIEVGAGGVPVYLTGNSIQGGAPASIDGRSAYPTEHCEALGDAGDIVVGDFSQYLLATKGSVNTAMSVHLRFDYDEVAFKSTFRVDGRPAWEQSLRPRKGASAKRVSPFVKLAARA